MNARIFFTLYMVMVVVGVSFCLSLSAGIKESLVFAHCEFCSPPVNGVIVGVKNVGTTGLTIVDVYVDHVSLADKYGHRLDDRIEVRQTRELFYPFNWSSSGEYCSITLITARENAFSTSEMVIPSETLFEIESVSWDSLANTTSIVVRNTGIRTRKIVRLFVSDFTNSLEVTAYTNLNSGKLLSVNQTVTIILSWSNALDSLWVSNQTYRFLIMPATGMHRFFNSTTPA